MDEPRAPRTDEPPLEQAATAVRAWWVRLLHGAGVGAVWTVGLSVVVVALGILFALWFSGRPEGGRITVSLANRGLARVSNLKLSAERSFLL